MRIRFLTSTPLSVTHGSGTYVGIATLAHSLRELGVEVEIVAPRLHLPVFTLERLVFNETLRWRRDDCDVTVGFDLDGYRVAGWSRTPHIASIKGVIADEMNYERGFTRAALALQARCEAAHVRRATLVMTTSRYAASRVEQCYGRAVGSIVPELIDLRRWRELLAQNPAEPDPRSFTVLTVCRFYPRKRLHLLLEAAAQLPQTQYRIVGDGPEAPKLKALCRRLRIESRVHFLGSVKQSELAREYNRADLFCLPSAQEGFGIVFLEAMAAGKPIVAARAAAVPEVIPQGELVEPESAEALAAAIARIERDPDLRAKLSSDGFRRVKSFDSPRIAQVFLEQTMRTLSPTRAVAT